jgi:hypothetical protein
MEVSGQLHTLADLLLRKEPQYPLDKRLGPRASINIMEKRKISCPAGNQALAVQPLTHSYND